MAYLRTLTWTWIAAMGALTPQPGALMAADDTHGATQARHTNRLAQETSPYLLQHAHNPVDWYPWGPEAFEEARRRGVPIFLSIGYSTCYWCHVMERESFENEAIASIMNEHFVCVKVDREERPDVDDIYMAGVQILSGHGGWPMSVWLTPPGTNGPDDPGLEPFFAGTYFPAEADHGRVAFPQLLENISQAWTTQHDQVVAQAGNLARAIRDTFAARADPVPVDEKTVGQAVAALLRMYDRDDAGFGRAPKFPQPVFLQLLMEVHDTIEDPAVQDTPRKAIRHTLDRMATGGMYDQVGGGFHRYSTDAHWLVPHFEKMLYDNGQLACLYARAYRRWGDEFDASVVRGVLDYVLREMTDASGMFYSAQDAEVNAREGLNYLWTRDEFAEVLGPEDAQLASTIYSLDRGTNFQDPHHPDEPRRNVLFLRLRPDAFARELKMTDAEFAARRHSIDRRLYAARALRDQPRLDDKVIAGWNGLMIAGFAEGGAALHDEAYVRAAARAAGAVLEHLRDESGTLMRTARKGRAKTPAFFEDYAMLIAGLLRVHEAGQELGIDTGDMLEQAERLVAEAERRFQDPDHPGLFFDALPDQDDLIVRTRSTYDGAVPCGGSVMLNDYIDLYTMTGKSAYRQSALHLLGALSRPMSENPLATCNATRALHRLLAIDAEGVASLAGERDAPGASADAPPEPVKVFAPGERVAVPATGAVTFPIRLEIDEGYHIMTNEPGVEDLLPTTVRLEGSTGVDMAVRFPPGHPFRVASLPEDVPAPNVYTGEVELQVTLRRNEDEWKGRPILLVAFQACNDSECLRPQLVELDLAIDKGE